MNRMPTTADLEYARAMFAGRRGLRTNNPALVFSATIDAWRARERVRDAGGEVDHRLCRAISLVARTGMSLSQAIDEVQA
jgi:hypothetical protein